MRYFIIGASGVMMLGLIIATVIYQNQTPIPPRIDQLLEQRPTQPETQPEDDNLHPIQVTDTLAYSLDNEQLNISYDSGTTWKTVPIEKELLFNGEYQGTKQQLIDDSFIFVEDFVGFLYSDGPDWDKQTVYFTYSQDQGDTWHVAVVSDSFSVMRFRKVVFLDEQFGYVIISGWRTMSQEFSTVFLTHDGGATWEETTNSDVTSLIYNGGFMDKNTGFLSFGTINPEAPTLYTTQDGGGSWNEAVIEIPAEYESVFVIAEVPFIEEGHLAVLVNQGPNGDYLGGQVKGKFVSNDNGMTWEFSTEVDPNETE